MSWYKHTECIGFPKKLLPIIGRAIDEEKVVWIAKEVVGFNTRGNFTWCGCLWHIHENNFAVEYLKLLEGKLDSEELTAQLLRG